MIQYFVYILLCSDGTYYIGKTSDINNRLRKHNGEIKGGAKYTRSRRPVVLVYSEEAETLSDALKREMALKKLSRKEKEKLIS
ncbi:MAG TPA: GIY-YIG nuclease family protein [Candidatus Levybacteria bacterium]|nr:GIY-YIG nuclease family protein [Candidatus Levybacteria bacterium]